MDMESSKRIPFEIQDVEKSKADEIMKYFTGYTGFVRVGPKGYLMRSIYKAQALHIYNMPLRSDDVFITSYPRSGTTWMRELVWMIDNNLNYAESLTTMLSKRCVTLEFSMLLYDNMKKQLLKENSENENNIQYVDLLARPAYERLASTPSTRHIHTHLPMSLLPPDLLDTSKVIHIARDLRDVVVSFYHYCRMNKAIGFLGDFKIFLNLFISDCIGMTPYFENIKEAWMKRHHSNMLFQFYEDMTKDLPATIRRVSAFLNKQYSEEQVTRLCQHLSIDSFRNNKSLNYDAMKEIGLVVDGEQPFIRKGKSGGWRNYFTEEMQEQANFWIQENLRDTDLRFPSINMS